MRNLTILLFLGLINLDQFSCSDSTVKDLPSEEISLMLDQDIKIKSKSKKKSSARQTSQQMEQAYESQKEKHREEVKAYHKMQKYSPFYLKNHPEERENGDISHIQQLSEQKSSTGDELAGVEQVFEKNVGSFNKLMSQSDAAKQLEGVKTTVKNSIKQKKQKKATIAKMINADELEDDNKTNEKESSEDDEDDAPPKKMNLKLYEKEAQNADNGQLYDHFSRKEFSLIDQNNHNYSQNENENVFFEPKQSGDFSKEASDGKPQRKMMDKIAQLSTQVFAMQKRIN